jgi:cytoskeleton protein RodZ
LWYSLGTVNGGDYDNGQGAGQIGPILEKRRLEIGLSLKEVEQATKIRTRYLEGLEREDPTVLPDPVYARGFLKTYANFLGLDGERLSRELRDRRSPRRERQLSHDPGTSDFEQPLITPGGVGGAERRRVSGATILTIALAVLLLAAVIGALYYVGSRSAGSGAEDAPEEPAVEQEDPSPSQKEGPATETTTGGATRGVAGEAEDDAASETVPVTVRVVGAPAGLTVTVDGAGALDQFAQPGFSQTFEARNSVTVSTANAGAVEVEVDGENLGRLGRNGQGATREFPVQPAG